MENIITFQDLQELVGFIQPHTYDYVYISLGSKMNESVTTFSYPIKDNEIVSNAEYQMIPAFIRLQPETNKILSLVIDDFHNSTLHKWNINSMKNTLKHHKNVQLVFFDQNITLSNITHIIQTITNVFKNIVSPTHILVCNYICFKSSNLIELNFENQLPTKIQKAMGLQYKDCFYQWFGYSFYTYNHIYHYNSYHLQKLMNFNYITSLLNKILKNKQLDIYNIETVDYELQRLNKYDRKWSTFQDEIICFV